MLYEIICEKFHQQKISFHEGLNVVLGDDLGSNSIGKSTLLMIVDFVFGGKDYLMKSGDVHRNIGHHVINFCFKFDDEKFFFCRDTNDSERVYECDAQYIRQRELTLSGYTHWLEVKYKLDIKDLSFRQIVGRFFRIYGRENLNEKRPLDAANKEPSHSAVNALLKIMKFYDEIMKFEEIYSNKKDKLDVFKKAQNYDFLPQKLNKQELKTIHADLARLQEEKEIIEKQTITNVSDIETEKLDAILVLRKELSTAKRLKTRFESRLNALENIEEGKHSVNNEDLSSLAKFFPNIDIRSIDEIQMFHTKLNGILAKEINDERSRLEQLVSSANEHITEILSSIKDIDNVSNVSSLNLKKYAKLQSISDDLEKRLTANNDLVVLDTEKKDAYKRYQQVKMETVEKLRDCLNRKVSEINDFLYDGKKKPPILTFTEGDYKFYTSDDTGTGTSFKNLIIYDLSILSMTKLPALIHDSCLLKQIADMPIAKLLQLYKNSSKQIFISLDKKSSYTEESQKILNDKKVIELSNNGNELFGYSWSDK